MAQISISLKQKQTYRDKEQTCGRQVGGRVGISTGMDKQQSPTAQHRKPTHSISGDKP